MIPARAECGRGPLRIAIVGYGIAGIAAAILLRRQGHEIVHFERARYPSFAGAGLLLHGTGLAILQKLGLLNLALARGAPVTRIIGNTRSGRTIMELDYETLAPGAYGLGIQRAALFKILRGADTQAQRLATASEIVGVDAERGYLITSNGARLGPFGLIVGADGADSLVRTGLQPLICRERRYAWGAMLCLLDEPSGRFDGRVSQHFSGGDHVSIWPVGSLSAGLPQRVNLSWRFSDSDQPRLAIGNVGEWKRRVSELCPTASPLLQQLSGMDDLLPATYRDLQLRRYCLGRVVLIGDAAHPMSPQLGQGASMALLDAYTLATALSRHPVGAALREFDRIRRAPMVVYQRLSRLITPIFQSNNRFLIALRDQAFYPLSSLPVLRRTILRALNGQAIFPARPYS